MQTFAQANAALAKYVSPKGMTGVYTLERMKKLMQALGNPQDQLKVIHVAGTSGKTSTCYYLAALLQAAVSKPDLSQADAGQGADEQRSEAYREYVERAAQSATQSSAASDGGAASLAGRQAGTVRRSGKVGLTVSPHIDEVNERLQINLTPLPEAEFCRALDEFIKLVGKTGIKPTYFELLVALAYWYFAKTKVDYAVVEVGLGGLLDGTNVVNLADKVCVITDIGLDHTEILGETIEAIAAQKAGIIMPGNTVFIMEQTESALAVIKQVARTKTADLVVVPQTPKEDELAKLLLMFQRRNWWLALTAFDHISERDNLPALTSAQLLQSLQTHTPARMDIYLKGNKTIVFDGAHNAQKMQALSDAMHEKYGDAQIATLLAIKDNPVFKTRTDLSVMGKLSRHIIVTGFKAEQDFPIKSVEPKVVAEHIRKLGVKSVQVIADPKAAMRALLARPEPILLVTGSFYLMNHVRPYLTKTFNQHKNSTNSNGR